MIKKHLITCSVILVLFIVSELFICSTSIKRKAVSVTTIENTGSSIFIPRFVKYSKDVNDEINFADESIPANNKRVNHKLKVSLREHSFSNVQSNVLHKKAEILFPI